MKNITEGRYWVIPVGGDDARYEKLWTENEKTITTKSFSKSHAMTGYRDWICNC